MDERIDVKQKISEAINNGLLKKGLNKKQLAEQIPISQTSITNWTTGQKTPGYEHIIRINEILDINLFEILQEEERKVKRIKSMITNKQPKDIKDLNTLEKAKIECDRILANTGADKYPHAIYTMLEWLIIASIGLTYHLCLHDKRKEDGTIYEDIFYYLNNVVEEYGSDAEKDFFDMDMDLLESGVPLVGDNIEEYIQQECPNYDYAHECVSLWYRFKKAYDFNDESYFNKEFKVALLDVISKNSECY